MGTPGMGSPGPSEDTTWSMGALHFSDLVVLQHSNSVTESMGTRHHSLLNPSRSNVGRALTPRMELATTPSEGEKAPTIDGLHLDILREIFDFVTAPFSPADDNFGRVVSLTHVSRLWRTVLLDYGRPWSNIHIRGQALDIVATQITRCQRSSLFVFVKVPSRRTSRHSDPRTNIREAVQLIRKRRDHVTRLEVHMDCQTFAKQFGCEWPKLRGFVWNDTCPSGSHLHRPIRVDPANGGLPRLKNLSVKRGIEWPMNTAAQLTAFKLEGPIDLKPTALADFFRRNTSLVSLELNNVNVLGSSCGCREEPIELPHLTKLSIHKTTCRQILRLLNLPSLKRLWVFSLREQNPWPGCDWSEPCTPLRITTLKARYCASPYERITVDGHRGLDTQSLRFTEFSPTTYGAAMFRALANVSLSSVTSISLIDDMPEGNPALPTAAICALLEYLTRVTFMRLCPSGLVLEVVRRLGDDLELCPELRELEVVVAGRTCRMVSEVMVEMVKARAGGGAERKMRKVECSPPADSQRSEEVRVRRVWGKLRERAELEKYLSDE